MFRTPDGKKIADATSEQIFNEINESLKKPRYDGDACIVLTMPANLIAKAAEKFNAAIYEAYRDLEDEKTGMTRILVAIEQYVEVERLALMLDNDIKLILAKEHNIKADEDDIENAKAHAADVLSHEEAETGEAPAGMEDFNE